MKKLSQLITNQQPNFGQFQRVDDVNYLDANITDLKGKSLSTLAKRLKANQFCFMSISHERYMFGCAVVNLKSVSNCFVYVYDKTENQLIEINKVSPLAVGTQMPTTPNQGEITFSQARFKVQMQFDGDAITLSVKSKKITVNAQIKASQNPMCLCTRNSYLGWVYMQKQTALACTGTLQVGNHCEVLTPQNALAGIDWTLGYMAKETFWNWASINGLIHAKEQTHRVGLNLVCGVNDTSHTENSVWIDDRLYNMPLTIFDYNKNDLMQPWTISSNQQIPSNNRVELLFTPKSTRDDHTDLKAITSHFTQLIGVYSGKIYCDNQVYQIDNLWGVAEDHFAKW